MRGWSPLLSRSFKSSQLYRDLTLQRHQTYDNRQQCTMAQMMDISCRCLCARNRHDTVCHAIRWSTAGKQATAKRFKVNETLFMITSIRNLNARVGADVTTGSDIVSDIVTGSDITAGAICGCCDGRETETNREGLASIVFFT